jgi:circadian clock protein KaiB
MALFPEASINSCGGTGVPAPQYRLRLYVCDENRKSRSAVKNLRMILEEHSPGWCEVQIIDLLQDPGCAKRDNIIAIPTLVRMEPGPTRRVIGDLSDGARVLRVLELLD